MTLVERGLVQGGQIVLPKPLTLAEGTEVVVRIEPVAPTPHKGVEDDFASLPFFGMWADREDMADSAAWCARSANSGISEQPAGID